MAVRWYVMPAETVSNRTRPAFLNTLFPAKFPMSVFGLGGPWGWKTIWEGWAIGWVDLTAGEHNTYNGQPGVRFFTGDLDATLGAAAVTVVQGELADRNYPSAWVNTSLAWREVLRRTIAFMLITKRYYTQTGSESMNVGRPVDTVISALPVGAQARIAFVSTSLGLSAAESIDTIESLMLRWADEYTTNVPVIVGGVTV